MEKFTDAVAAKETGNASLLDGVIDSTNQLMKTSTQLEKLGFKAAKKKLDTAQKLAIAYGKYGFVTQQKVDKFNEKLQEETIRTEKNYREYKRLQFTPIDQYEKVPPQDALVRLEAAMNDGIFDTFEVATIRWVKEIIDPIIFGRIDGCTDRFFVCQWDSDVSIEDIVGA